MEAPVWIANFFYLFEAHLRKEDLFSWLRKLDVYFQTSMRKSELVEALCEWIEENSLQIALSKQTNQDLKLLCSRLSLPTSGNKDALIERIAVVMLDSDDGDDDDDDDDDDEWESLGFSMAHFFRPNWLTEFQLQQEQQPARPYQQQALQRLKGSLTPTHPILLHVATGGGKTRIANDLIEEILRDGGCVLWLTMRWSLLYQAARDISRRHKDFQAQEGMLGRIGGESSEISFLPTSGPRRVWYTTIHTFAQRLSQQPLASLKPRFVVWDECHYAMTSKRGQGIFRWCKANKIPLLGLTATPRRSDQEKFYVAYSKDFLSLVQEGYLAYPTPLNPIHTGIKWTPERSSDHFDFSNTSLNELAQNQKRNELICAHYAKNAEKYGKTIIFACNVQHANTLADILNKKHGIAARPIHSEQDNETNQSTMKGFQSNRLRVLINVAMLTHGVDVPEIRTVFLCRPTLSDILFSQMVGRASRLAPQKPYFYIVEFTDNLTRFGESLVRCQNLFVGAYSSGSQQQNYAPLRAYSPKLHTHSFDPHGAVRWIPEDPSIHEAIQSLWYRENQTFGIEFELTSDHFSPQITINQWLEIAEPIRKKLSEILPKELVAERCLTEYHGHANKNHNVWNVEKDGSCGWEVTSRILKNEDGFKEAALVCDVLTQIAEQLKLKINYSTGTHIHVGWTPSFETLKTAIQLVKTFEPALATLVSPSRIANFSEGKYDVQKPNFYCQPLSSILPNNAIRHIHNSDQLLSYLQKNEKSRYTTFNVLPLQGTRTVEIRMHGGTTEGRKILLWLSLWMQILWAAEQGWTLQDVPDTNAIVPSGDIVELGRRFLPTHQHAPFLQRLHIRRMEILALWAKELSLSDWAQYAADWCLPSDSLH